MAAKTPKSASANETISGVLGDEATHEGNGIAAKISEAHASGMSEAAFRKDYPLVAKMIDTMPVASPGDIFIRITAKTAGFRRGGMSHPATPTEHRFVDFPVDLDQLEAILGEAELVVEFTDKDD
ncbi:hypothetical protein [Rhizobium herbae]